MVNWWWIIAALAGLVALTILVAGLGALANRRPWRGLGGIVGGGALLAISAVVLLLGLDVQTYSRLSYERPVGTIDLHQTGDGQFAATLTRADMPGTGSSDVGPPAYSLSGDEWRVEARVLKWKPWANLLGADALYRLDRVSGEFTDAAAEQTGPHSAYSLRPANDTGLLSRLSASLHDTRLIDTVYGSAALMPMADGARYELAMTQTGLVARPANDAATKAVGGWK